MPNNSADEIKKLNEEYEDGLFRLIMNDVAEKEGKRLFEENEQLKKDPANLPSSEDVKRFGKLLDSNTKSIKKYHVNCHVSKTFRKIAVAMITIIVIFHVLMVTVQAFRIRVMNFLISIEPKYTSIQLENAGGGQNDGRLLVNWANSYVPAYIPEGYEVNNVSCSDSVKKIIYKKQGDDSSIIYTEYESINSIAIDTENASRIETVKINGRDGTLSVKDSVTSVVWEMDNRLFTVQGRISMDEAVKIAEGVKFVK